MPKTFKNILIALMTLILFSGCFSGGVLLGWATNATPAFSTAFDINKLPFLPGNDTPESETPDQEELLKPFWETWNLIQEQYVDQPVDEDIMVQGAIRGMVNSLGDPHTAYMSPDEFHQMNVQQEGEYEGIGAWVDIYGEYLTIIGPMANSPAEEAGLKPGDIVIAIDGEDMTGVDGNIVLNHILGPSGTIVVLTIFREDVDEPFDVEIKRAKITVPSVEGEILDDNIAYIGLYNFGDKTTSELRKTLKDLLAENPQGLILDLRGNGGGYLHTSIEVTSQFIEGGQIVMYEEFGDGSRRTLKSTRNGLATDIPLVLLIDEGSASASEIVAGAIQDYDRALLVGMTSYGKGSIQNVIPIQEEQGAVRITIARWLTPNERQIHELGIEPDIVIEYTEEDFEAERDPQLEKALELLLEN
jgi:carboxyl-terminal processing protease